jgi:RNA polymerase sigma-70 factor (ECF subfamily)
MTTCVSFEGDMDRTAMTTDRELDEQVLRAVQSGERDAFERFVKRFGNRIYAFGMRVCNQAEDAEDVYQETLVAVYRTLATLREPRALTTWLYRIVANACRSKRRKGSFAANREIPLDELLPHGEPFDAGPVLPNEGGPADDVYRRELAEALGRAVRDLPHDYRVVWLMRDAEGLSTQETAEALQISLSNVKMRLHRARLRLRQQLAHLRPRGANT